MIILPTRPTRAVRPQIFVLPGLLGLLLGLVVLVAPPAVAAPARPVGPPVAMATTGSSPAAVSGQLRTRRARPVRLQLLSGRWRTVSAAVTDSGGRYLVTDPVLRSGRYRVVAPRVRVPRRVLRRVVTRSVVFSAPAPVSALPVGIPDTEQMRRAQSWLDVGVPYSQSAYYANAYGRYRTDCSGFASMVWALPSSYNTRTLGQVSHPISKTELAAGDILLSPGYHAVVFAGWYDATGTSYWGYEQTGGIGTVLRKIPYPYWGKRAFAPYRKN